VFAGAAREAVFSNPDVIKRVNADFVPVALKAGLVNNPPDDEEGRLCREIGRSKLAPQGICVVNSAGKVLAWTMAFDDDKSVLAFLDHSAKRFAQFPDAKKPVAAERYGRFPSAKVADVEDSGKVPVIIDRHPEGKHCPGATRVRQGTVLARVFGRALDKDGKPMADTVRQEHYVEDRFHVPVAMQEALAKALADAGTERFRLADDLARQFVSHAFLGQLDVNPLAEARDGKGALKHCEFWAQPVGAGGNGPVRVRVEGKSEAAGGTSDAGRGGDGAFWRHEVKLAWEGIIEIKKDRVPRLLLVARGSEKLKWGNKNLPKLKGQADVTVLVGGHAIDLSCGVRYGIIGEPVAADEAGDAEAPKERPQEVPAEAARQITETLGPPFLVFRDKVQEELKLSAEQKKKLEKRFQDTVQDTMQLFQKLADKEPEEREKELHAYREKAQENLTAFLQGLLQEEQFKRLRQVMLQRDRLFALLGNAEVAKELEITDKQRQQFAEVAQEFQKKFEPLMKEAQKGGNPQEIGPKIRKIRKEQEERIEALLSDAQKKQWKEMLGKPLDAPRI
jgi:hypothetical protein